MSQGGGGRRNNKCRGPLKADDHQNRYAKAINQQSGSACNGNLPKDKPGRPVCGTKMKEKSQKQVSLTESKKNVQEVGKNYVENASFDSNCSKSECMQIKIQYQELLAERLHDVETIKTLKEEIQQLTFKFSQNNLGKEITMKVETSTKHTIDPRETHGHIAGLSDGGAGDQSSSLNNKLWEKEAKEESRNQKNKCLEEVVPKNSTLGSISEEEKYVNAVGILQYCVDSANDLILNDRSSGQQDASRICDVAESLPPNYVRYNWPERNRNEKRQTQVLCEARCEGGSNRSDSRDCRSQYGCQGRRNKYYEQQYEYDQWKSREREGWRYNQSWQPVKCKGVVNEIEGDLFTAPRTSSLAHCVAEDMRMGSGIAVTFRLMFERVDELLAQDAQTGDVAVLEDEGRFIYYLVTKRQSHEKPWLKNLESSLLKMRQHMLENNVHDVAMPRIGCGLDRLNWYDVRSLLIEIFGEDDVCITVYNFNPNNVAKEITMAVGTSTRHLTASRDADLTGPSWGDACGHSARADRNKSWKKKVQEDSRSQKSRNLEEVITNCYANSISEEEKYIRSDKATHGTDIQEYWDDSVDCTQSDGATCQEGVSETYEAEIILPSNNITYNQPKQNRYNIRRDEQRQQCEDGQQQYREIERWRNYQGQQTGKHKEVVNEIDGDLFTAPKTFSLAHCVAEDMCMKSGIAVTFRQMFKQVDQLLAQRVRTGAVAVLEDEGRFIYYLVTKKYSNGKPQFECLRSALIEMRQHMLANNVHDVAMPRIGCGLDRLEWRDVRRLLIEIFGKDNVTINVYNFNKGWGRHRHLSAESSRVSSSSDKRQSFKSKMKSKDAKKKHNKRKKNKRNQSKKHK